jgi:hypothetical protein
MFIKSSPLTVGFIFSLATLALASPSQAALINFSSWNQFGDVAIPSLGQADLSTNALQNDDLPDPDSKFNFSNKPAVDAQTLESNLGLPSQSLDPEAINFVTAFEGSGLQQKYTFTEDKILSFNWIFLTNDQTRNISGFNFDDYAFIALDNQVQTLASTNISVSNLIPSSTNFSREVSGTYTRTFSPGIYNIALGVVDVGSFDSTSALKISNAQLSSQAVPEPSTVLGTVVAMGLSIAARFRKHK